MKKYYFFVLAFLFLLQLAPFSHSQEIIIDNNNSKQVGLITKVGFSTTPDNIDNQQQDVNWVDPIFHASTRFGNVLRLSISSNLNTTQQNNIRKTIDSSLAINREIILLIPIEIHPTQLKSKLNFLNNYFSTNKIKWFELGNEAWVYYWQLGYNPFQSDTSYMRRIRQYSKVLRDSITLSAKIIIGAWEGSAADWENPVPTGFRWTKQLIDSLYQFPITTVDAVSFHLYSARYNSNGGISHNRLLSTGKCIDTSYISVFSFSYNSFYGLIDLLKLAIGNRDIMIMCSEYSHIPDILYTAQFRKGMGNALVFANTFCYLSRRNVGYFAFHQFGKDTYPPNPIYDGYNCINNSNYNLPISYAVRMLSKMKDTLISFQNANTMFTTYGSAWNSGLNHLNDSTGSLDSMTGIPYITSIKSRSRDTLTYCLVNMSNMPAIVTLTNLDSAYNKFNVSTMSANSLTDNNDYGNNIKPIDTIVHVRDFSLPGFSILTIEATKSPSLGIKFTGVIPNTFYLSQNYPNPFNPKTNIRYVMPKKGFVKLIVFDAIGREIETLVNNEQAPGIYEVQWDATNYPSGIYFYKIMIDNFTYTRCMTFIK